MGPVIEIHIVLFADVRDRVILDELANRLTVLRVASVEVRIKSLGLLLCDVIRIALLGQEQVNIRVLAMLCAISLAAQFGPL